MAGFEVAREWSVSVMVCKRKDKHREPSSEMSKGDGLEVRGTKYERTANVGSVSGLHEATLENGQSFSGGNIKKTSAEARSDQQASQYCSKGIFLFCGVYGTRQKKTGSCYDDEEANARDMTSCVTKWSTRRAKSSFLYLKNQSIKIKKGLMAWRGYC